MRDADILNRVDGVDMKNDTPYAGGGGFNQKVPAWISYFSCGVGFLCL